MSGWMLTRLILVKIGFELMWFMFGCFYYKSMLATNSVYKSANQVVSIRNQFYIQNKFFSVKPNIWKLI